VNILYLHRTQGTGVEGVHIWGIANALSSLGHSVAVLSPQGLQTEQQAAGAASDHGPARTTARQRLFGLVSRNFPEFLFELAELSFNFVLAAKLKEFMTGSRVDAIYERYAIFSFAGTRAARRAGIPLVLEVNYTSRSPLVRKRSRLLLPLADALDRWLFARAALVVVVSSYLREQLIDRYGVPPEKILVTPNAADPEAITPQTPAIETLDGVRLAGRKVIGFVGGFYPWHGLPLLVEGFSRIADKVSDAVLLLVGDGPERAAVEALARQKGLADRVLFAGRVAHGDLAPYVASFTVGVMPDSNEYGSPMKIFEYMAAGKPVIGPDYAPLLDVIEEGRQGFIFARGDVDSLARCLLRILGDEGLAGRMGEQARDYVVSERNWLNNARLVMERIEHGGKNP